ncbi:MAG: hypothetical protein ABIG89_04410 [Candidatus Woesearchaeota archaeon]
MAKIRKFKRKSQVEQMLFYILAIFVIGMILLLGVKYIGKLLKQVETIDLVEFKTSLQDDTDVMVTKYGSWKVKTYVVPKELKKVCFFTADKYKSGCIDLPDLDPVMCDAWQSGSQNVMTVPFVLESPINLTKMIVDKDIPQGYKCFAVSDRKLSVKMTGIGNGVMISEA